MVQVLDASCCGHRRIIIRTNDTDVAALAVSIVCTIPAEELCAAYGRGKHLQNIAVHTIAAALGPERAFSFVGVTPEKHISIELLQNSVRY